MGDWGTERLDTNRKVRSILVSHFVDMGRLSFHVYPGKVMLRGSLLKVPGAPGDLTSDVIRIIFEEIEDLPKIRKVFGHFDNWRQEGPKSWVPLVREQKKRQAGAANPFARASTSRTGAGGTYDINVLEIVKCEE